MKKYSVLKIIMYLILITNITLIAISGTYAKYTSTGSTERAYANVAKWNVLVNDVNLNAGDMQIEFDLFDCIYDSDGTSYETDVKTINLSNEPSGDYPAEWTIAPGTSGNATITIKNESNVNVDYKVQFTESNEFLVPIEYSLDNNTFYKIHDIEQIINAMTNKITYGDSETINIYWRWQFDNDGMVYNQTDMKDTNLGLTTENIQYQVLAKIIVTQID